jgi:hypothetical protein
MIVRFRERSRPALTTVAVLVCLILIMLIGAALLKVGVAQRELGRGQERRLQAEWLVESGLDRALARLAADPTYAGESWPIQARDLSLPDGTASAEVSAAGSRPAGMITISVARVPASANRRRIHVRADYPLDPSRRSRQSKQILIDLQPDKAGLAP